MTGVQTCALPISGTTIPFPGFSGELHVSHADMDGDGTTELVVAAGAGGGPAVAILNGATGAVIQSSFAYHIAFTGGVFVSVGFFNNDNTPDIVTGAGPGGGPHVKVFDGSNLQVLQSFFAYNVAFTGGVSVASADMNGDNISEIITGAGPGGGPQVNVFDGQSLMLLNSFFAFGSEFTGGVYVGEIGRAHV